MANILARAQRYQSLTPAERALLRLLEGLAAVALIGAATAGAQYLASPAGAGLNAFDWPTIARVCAAGAAVALLMALAKYFKAHGDPALADALGVVATRVAGDTPPSPASVAASVAPAPQEAPEAPEAPGSPAGPPSMAQ